MSAFDHMAKALAPPEAVAPHRPGAPDQAGLNRTDRMRHALRAGRQDAVALGRAGGVRPTLVMPLLKADIAAGRVRRVKMHGRQFYELDASFDGRLQQRLQQAAQLLRTHGWLVQPPGQAPGHTGAAQEGAPCGH